MPSSTYTFKEIILVDYIVRIYNFHMFGFKLTHIIKPGSKCLTHLIILSAPKMTL